MSQPDAPLTTALLFGPFLVGVLGVLLLEPPARAWHTSLRKWPYRPPNFIHPVAWTWSYLSMGYSSYLVYTSGARDWAFLATAALYGVHLALLNSWGVVFYAKRRIDWGLYVMVALDAVALTLMAAVWPRAPLATLLSVPYVCWLLLLTLLNDYMRRHNELAAELQASKEALRAAHAAPLQPAIAASEHDKRQ